MPIKHDCGKNIMICVQHFKQLHELLPKTHRPKNTLRVFPIQGIKCIFKINRQDRSIKFLGIEVMNNIIELSRILSDIPAFQIGSLVGTNKCLRHRF